MAKQSKRKQAALASVDRERAYPLAEAVALVKATPPHRSSTRPLKSP